MRTRRCFLPTALLLILTACGGEPSADSTAETPLPAAHHDGIAWFDGSVDDAFTLAKQQNKPLFLYWGAVWCPPCHYLRAKIFTREEFVAKTRNFVAVYLDGDTERAQLLGERFGTKGYPTVILFDPSGQEITRIPSALPVERYADVLDRAVARARPVKAILKQVLANDPGTAEAADLNLLAFYSWGQDHEVQLESEARLGIFRSLYAGTPPGLAAERSRFLTLYLGEAIRRARGGETADEPVLSGDERRALTTAVTDLLADTELRRLNLDLIGYWSRETV